MIDKNLSKKEARIIRAALLLALHDDYSLWENLKFEDKQLAKSILSDMTLIFTE